ncbi:MAG TPA: hypothetical protein VKX17_06960 [Planctomycetota bacterium]|nr:hypothetical protein [Planctomycetota bacterium]
MQNGLLRNRRRIDLWPRDGSNMQAGLFRFALDPGGNITSLSRDNGITIAYTYDAADWLLGEVWDAPSQIYAFSYDYDPAGNRLKMRRETTSTTEYLSAYYAYDKDNSLTRRLKQIPGADRTSPRIMYYCSASVEIGH